MSLKRIDEQENLERGKVYMVVRKGMRMELRDAPDRGTSKCLMVVPSESLVIFLKLHHDWVHVVYRDMVGWIHDPMFFRKELEG